MDEDSCICFFSIDCKTMSIFRIIFYIPVKSNNLKLFGIIFVKKSYWYTHNPIIIYWYIRGLVYIYCGV